MAVLATALAADFSPARLVDGSRPPMPLAATGWSDVRLALEVDENGSVTSTSALRATPGALPLVEPVIASWRFHQAEYLGKGIPSTVLVVSMFRPPQLFDNPSTAAPPRDLATPTDAAPYPVLETRPVYPPRAFIDGVAIVEVLVGIGGTVQQATLVGPAPGFETAALEAARRWIFRAARYRGQPVPAYVYLIFGFRAPIAAPPILAPG